MLKWYPVLKAVLFDRVPVLTSNRLRVFKDSNLPETARHGKSPVLYFIYRSLLLGSNNDYNL